MQYLYIAGIYILIEGWELGGNFLSFAVSPFNNYDIRLNVLKEATCAVSLPDSAQEWEFCGQRFFRQEGILYFCYEGDSPVSQVVVSSDYSECTIYIDPIIASEHNVIENNINIMLRKLVIGYLVQHNGVLLHSASIEWQGEAIIFSAMSGTGKSTQAHLWQEKYNVRIIDGDVGACRLAGDSTYIYGLPWCGSSNEYINDRIPIRAVVFLEQSLENKIERLTHLESALRLAGRCFLPHWDRMLAAEAGMDVVERLSGRVECYLLKCRPDFEAVELLKECLRQKRKD